MSCFRSLVLVLFGILGAQFSAWAQVPDNDDWANRTVISALPFTTTETYMSLATVESTDPISPCLPNSVPPPSESQTLWYSYTTGASTEYLTLVIPIITDPQKQTVVGMITVYTGSPGAFTLVSGGCNGYSDNLQFTRLAGLRLAPNTTYSIKVGATFLANQYNLLRFNVDTATQYHVTTTADTNDDSCDGTNCSLRDAISASNANPGAVIIPAGTYTLSLAGANEDNNATGDLDAKVGMGIYGAGMTQTVIDANHIDRVLHLDSHGNGTENFSIGDLTLRNGDAVVPASGIDDLHGGGMLISPPSHPDYVGFERIAVLSNHADEDGGGVYMATPGTIRDSLISNNSVDTYSGGGLEYTYDTRYHLDISGSTFSGNSASSSGGGIYAQGVLYLSNSTVTGNHASYEGGGIMSEFRGSLTMTSSTVVFNSAGDNANLLQIGGGIKLDGAADDPENVISNSIIAYNTVANPADDADCAIGVNSPTFSSSHNLVQNPNNCGFSGSGDVTSVDPLVSATLAYNGGLTPTHALLAGSPAISAGDISKIPDSMLYDQRGAGHPRTVNGTVDMGAIEYDTIFAGGFETTP